MFGRVRAVPFSGALCGVLSSALCLLAAACASEPSRSARLTPPDLRGLSVPAGDGAPLPASLIPRSVEQRPGSLPLAASPSSTPVIVEAAGADRSWTVVCEAHADTDGSGAIAVSLGPRGELNGDRLERYLGLSNGQLEPIDDFVTASDEGRFVVVRRGGRTELVDTRGPTFDELSGVDARREATLPSRQRLQIRGGGLYYARRAGSRTEIVERALASGEERLLYAGPEEVHGLELDPTANYVVAEVATADANGNGRLEPQSVAGGGGRPCSGPIPEVRARRSELASSGWLLIPRAGGRARRVDDLALVFGRQLIRRRADGGVLLERDGQTRVLGTDLCQGRVLFAEPERSLLLLGCALPKKPWRFGVELWSGLSRRTLPIDVAALSVDEPAQPRARLFPLYPGADTMLFDAERQTLRRFEPGDLVLAVHADHALIRRGRTAFVYDAKSDQLRGLPGKLDPLVEALQTGPMVHASPFVVDLTTGRWVGNVSGQALALSHSGDVLLAAVPASAEALARGPLLWQSPVAAP